MEPMLRMQYLVPANFPEPYGELDREIADLSMSLKTVDKKWTEVPNSALRLKLNVFLDGASLEIKKRDQLVYINIFCIDGHRASEFLAVVQELYNKHNLGTIKLPAVENWIYYGSVDLPE